jgi:hypothetical protein
MENKEEISVLDAKHEAQKIAFAPFVFQVARILRDKGVLTFLKKQRKKGANIEKLHSELNISEYGLRVLLELASTSGVVNRTEEEVYTLTKTGYFLDTDMLTKVNMDFTHDVCYKGLFHLEEAIDEGTPAGLKEIGDWSTLYEGLSQFPPKEQESWLNFDHYYSSDSFPEALPIIFKDEPKTVLDVGGNTGKFSMKCCDYNENVKMTIVDLPGQINLATRNIEMHELTDRINYFPLNMLHPNKPFPKADAIWMSQFLDCFSEDEIVTILKHAVASMASNTKLFIMETFWDNQKYPAATFSLAATSVYFTAMANGNSKMYGIKRFKALVEKAGLEVVQENFPIGVSHTILTCMLPKQ